MKKKLLRFDVYKYGTVYKGCWIQGDRCCFIYSNMSGIYIITRWESYVACCIYQKNKIGEAPMMITEIMLMMFVFTQIL